MSVIQEISAVFRSALFTKRCVICGKTIEFDEIFCHECASAKHIELPVCLKCGCEKADCICKKEHHKPEYKAVVAPYYYRDSIAQGILNCKMHDLPHLTKAQGAEIAKTVNSLYELVKFDCVTYIPMRNYDEKYRGFNQSALLAKEVSRICGLDCAGLLVKKRKTKMQKRQGAESRYVNMYNAFDLAKNAEVAGKTILLIDDVKTTGATLSSAALTLKAYGAKAVYCAVFAIVK